MSVSTEVQRTLVKSPPELWSELSNPEALARHLSELGEIRITSIEPETKVEWESESASGVVQLKQSGWGTRVTLSVTRAAAGAERRSDTEPEAITGRPESTPELVVEPEPVAAEPEPELTAEPEPVAVEPEPEPATGPEPVAEEPEPQHGLFARLFRKRRAKQAAVAAPEPEPIAADESRVEPAPEPEVVALAAPEPIYPEPEPEPEPPEPAADLASELQSVEAQMTTETTELLTGVLDRLGAAHHRPFSRG